MEETRPHQFSRCLALAARGESPAAFDRRCIPSDGVASRSHTAGILPRRALSDGRMAGLGATRDFHHGLAVKLRLTPTRKTERSLTAGNFSQSPATRGLDISGRRRKTCLNCHDVTLRRCLEKLRGDHVGIYDFTGLLITLGVLKVKPI